MQASALSDGMIVPTLEGGNLTISITGEWNTLNRLHKTSETLRALAAERLRAVLLPRHHR